MKNKDLYEDFDINKPIPTFIEKSNEEDVFLDKIVDKIFIMSLIIMGIYLFIFIMVYLCFHGII